MTTQPLIVRIAKKVGYDNKRFDALCERLGLCSYESPKQYVEGRVQEDLAPLLAQMDENQVLIIDDWAVGQGDAVDAVHEWMMYGGSTEAVLWMSENDVANCVSEIADASDVCWGGINPVGSEARALSEA